MATTSSVVNTVQNDPLERGAKNITPLFEQLSTSSYAMVFGGQGVDWYERLQQTLDSHISSELEKIAARAQELLKPISDNLLAAHGRKFDFTQIITGKAETAPTSWEQGNSVVGIPCALAGFIAQLLRLQSHGLDWQQNPPRAVEGYSAGLLASEYIRGTIEPADLFAIAQIIGAASTTVARRANVLASASSAPMLSIGRIQTKELEGYLETFAANYSLSAEEAPTVAIYSNRNSVVVSGPPKQLNKFKKFLTDISEQEVKERKNKLRGGRVFDPVFNDVYVNIPYHHPAMKDVITVAGEWADQCGLSRADTERLAEYIVVETVDWVKSVDSIDAEWILDLGPGDTLTKISRSLVAGRGIGIVSVDTNNGFGQLFKEGAAPELPAKWEKFAPQLGKLPDGSIVVDTAFTRLTGRSPFLLAGMTPTTVDPAIVAAAANAGHWAELAGGGQVTPDIFNANVKKLESLLEPGRAVQFNTLHLDPYLWGLHLGSKRILQRARTTGSPFDGVVISAGIPEKKEAIELLKELNDIGIHYVAFKPGTTKQIKDVIEIAAEVPEKPVIMHVEGGKAGGHHSWEDLDDLLLSAYESIRENENIVLCVGGGIGTPDRAAEYLIGSWSAKYGDYPAMPVDGILIGTAAMAAKEATTSPQVKKLLAETAGNDAWIGAGEGKNGAASGRSQLGADLHEIDNSWAQCGRLLDQVAGNAKAVASRRDEIIEALSKTAKPYFGDLEKMTYGQLLDRVVELMFGTADGRHWLDITWQDRFIELVQRVEARFNEAENGTIVSAFAEKSETDNADKALKKLRKLYPAIDTTKLLPLDRFYFIEVCQKVGKPVPFVPIIDESVRKYFRSDSLWQAHDKRYSADEVCIIPGPAALHGISQVDEPVGDILNNFEKNVAQAIKTQPQERVSRKDVASGDVIDRVMAATDVRWNGRFTVNPIYRISDKSGWSKDNKRYVHLKSGSTIEAVSNDQVLLTIPTQRNPIAVRIELPEVDGVAPVIRSDDAIKAMVGLFSENEKISDKPVSTVKEIYDPHIIADHTSVTTPVFPSKLQPTMTLRDQPSVPDVFLAVAWRALTDALVAVRTEDGTLLASELINIVHLDHQIRIVGKIPQEKTEIITHAELLSIQDTEVGKVIEFKVEISDTKKNLLVALVERFALRGFEGNTPLKDPERAGGALSEHILDVTRKRITQTTIKAPESMEAYAAVSHDFNPIHTADAAARFVGLEGVIVHGMWLSSAAARVATAQKDKPQAKAAQPLVGWTARFLGMVKPGDDVVIQVDRVSLDKSADVIEVSARVDGMLVMSATGLLKAPFTVYAFPGQGIQRKGMGMDALSRSKAVREIWERADKHTRNELGFSILTIVRDNPKSIVIRGKEFHHPEGVLFLTQFTQVAMSTLAVAQFAELKEAGLFTDHDNFVTCGHSVGEYNAIAAVSGIIPLEPLLTVVYMRGTTMHSLVPRDEKGRSNYQMAAIRPAQIGLDDDQVFDFIEDLSKETGEFLQIVNFNLRGAQYAIAGTIKGIEILESKTKYLRAKHGGRPAFTRVPGIDVPFHSRVLYPGVNDFRELLDELVPEVGRDYVLGRYIPNLVPRPFSIDREYIQEVGDLVDSPIIQDMLENYDDWLKKPQTLAKKLIVELLAWQFASPVRWIETQDLVFKSREQGGYGAERFIEVGLAISPTLANMAKSTTKLSMFSDVRVEVLNIERDRAVIWGEDSGEDEEFDAVAPEKSSAPAAESKAAPAAPQPAAPAAPVAPQSAGPRPDDITFDGGDALVTLISSWTSMRPDQISATDTVESITDGASSRRNQLLIDLGAELNITSIDGAADATVPVLRTKVAGLAKNYKPFGTVISEMISDQLRKVFGPAGKRASYVTERVTKVWELGPGWAKHALVALALGTREGNSVRGGDLANLGTQTAKNAADVDAMIDKAILSVGEAQGVTVSMPASGGDSAGGTVDVAALREFTDQVVGEEGVLAEAARTVLRKLDLLSEENYEKTEDLDAELAELVREELGSDWARAVTSSFSGKKAILFDDRWASAREDLARFYLTDASAPPRITGTGEIVAQQAQWWAKKATEAKKSKHAQAYKKLAQDALVTEAGEWSQETAVVTGASKGSIAAAVVAKLLAGGATVIATTSQIDDRRREFFRDLYHNNAEYNAKLWVLPANMASYSDIDALTEWIETDQSESLAGNVILAKPPMYPTLLFPFAAPRVLGELSDAGPKSEQEMRVLLWAVERLITKIGAIGKDVNLGSSLHVVLPGSPNHGRFGGDGAYGESKASLEAIVNKWSSEKTWSSRITLSHAIIGWVKGTGLMGANDAVAEEAEAQGVRTYTTEEMANNLLTKATKQVREKAKKAPVEVDLTGGLAELNLNMAALVEKGTQAAKTSTGDTVAVAGDLTALPSPVLPYTQPRVSWPGKVSTALEDMIVIVGGAEVGPYGSSRTRYEMEVYDEISASGIAELAWLTGLIYWDNGAQPGWYDAKTQEKIPESDIAENYRAEIMENIGIRRILNDSHIFDGGRHMYQSLFLEKDLHFTVSDEAMAESFREYSPENTIISQSSETGDWTVTRKAGTEVFVKRRIEMDRSNGAQIPTNFDPTVYGLSADMVKSIDRLTLWNMVATVDAFISSGFDPQELLQYVHPVDVASTQGTGMGGTTSIKEMYLNVIFGHAAQNDILQESLPNVVAAHVVQSYIGSYGSMIHPVAACATAAVSMEEGVDKIATGKASFVVTGGYDDINLEGIVGFANMSATADNDELQAKGISPKQFSRANDRRRAGFVEGQGGGTILLARGDVALEAGLPVLAVVAHAQSFGDGIHTSIPAPGMGALAAARGGKSSMMVKKLNKLGLTVDDISVISKHDTSTLMNDVNETNLHERIAKAIGRTEGNPMFIVSQKTLTGHAKGGAAAFQTMGLIQILEQQILPPNRNLDCVDDRLDHSEFFVWLREKYPVDESMAVRAGVITSLGFGHVSGLILLVHPEAFIQAIPAQQREDYLAQASARRTAGRQFFVDAMCGGKKLYRRSKDRRFAHDDEEENDLLLDAKYRLDETGHYNI